MTLSPFILGHTRNKKEVTDGCSSLFLWNINMCLGWTLFLCTNCPTHNSFKNVFFFLLKLVSCREDFYVILVHWNRWPLLWWSICSPMFKMYVHLSRRMDSIKKEPQQWLWRGGGGGKRCPTDGATNIVVNVTARIFHPVSKLLVWICRLRWSSLKVCTKKSTILQIVQSTKFGWYKKLVPSWYKWKITLTFYI